MPRKAKEKEELKDTQKTIKPATRKTTSSKKTASTTKKSSTTKKTTSTTFASQVFTF